MTRDTIIHCAATVYVLSCTAFILFVLLRYCGLPSPRTASLEDVPFEEFYLDLHTYAVDADFSRGEAQALYGVWQRQRDRVTN